VPGHGDRRRGGGQFVQQHLLPRGQRGFLALQIEQRINARLVFDERRLHTFDSIRTRRKRPAETVIK
jgi:hypothetical protein